MTRSELITILAERFPKLPLRDTDFAVKTILDSMTKSLAEGQRIEIRGFGSFSLTRRPPRVGRNPKSGEQVMVPEKSVPHFKPGKELRERVDLSASKFPIIADAADDKDPEGTSAASIQHGHAE
jgi:integration host factor subunit beta